MQALPILGCLPAAQAAFIMDVHFTNLLSVVEHYSAHRTLGPELSEKTDLVEYLKSL